MFVLVSMSSIFSMMNAFSRDNIWFMYCCIPVVYFMVYVFDFFPRNILSNCADWNRNMCNNRSSVVPASAVIPAWPCLLPSDSTQLAWLQWRLPRCFITAVVIVVIPIFHNCDHFGLLFWMWSYNKILPFFLFSLSMYPSKHGNNNWNPNLNPPHSKWTLKTLILYFRVIMTHHSDACMEKGQKLEDPIVTKVQAVVSTSRFS
jgi:hypothetical protein